jgi:hypothetical protein
MTEESTKIYSLIIVTYNKLSTDDSIHLIESRTATRHVNIADPHQPVIYSTIMTEIWSTSK